jgi:methyl-accepting chemotaxis protein
VFSNLSLRTKLYLQYGIVLLPVFIVLAYFLHDNHNRFTAAMAKFAQYNSAVDAERRYKIFIDAVTDAVDTQKLGQTGLVALKETHDHLVSSGIQSDEAKQLLDALSQLHKSLSGDNSLDNLAANRTFIQQAKLQVTSIVNLHDRAIAADVRRDLAHSNQRILFSRALTLLIAVVAFLFARTLVKSLHKPLQSAVSMADRISKGNLNNPPAQENNTEIGRLLGALNSMNERLRHLMGEIIGTSNQVNEASQDIRQNNESLGERAAAASSTLEQISASLEEITATVSQTADRTLNAQNLARDAVSNVEKSSLVVREVVTTMDDIHNSSRRIVDIISVIDGIAFQTNILALNAAVEAARAGTHGAGFAVVANEVRNLAQRCATAAKDIKSLISNSVDKISAGTKLADNAGKAMEGTVSSIHKVSELLGEIALSATEQREGIAHINEAMVLLDEATQQTGTVVDQAAGIAHRLSGHSQNLDSLVNQFDLGAGHNTSKETISGQLSGEKHQQLGSGTRADRLRNSKPKDERDWQEF